MATLNELLSLIAEHGADSLQLKAGQAPAVFVRKEPRVLEMKPITGVALEALLEELASDIERGVLNVQGVTDGVYGSTAHGRFRWRARKLDDGLAVAFRPDSGDPGASFGGSLRNGMDRPTPPPGPPRTPAPAPRAGAQSARAVTLPPPPTAEGDFAFVDGLERDTEAAPPAVTAARTPRPGAMNLPGLLDRTLARGASDLLISSDHNATMRIAGEWVAVPGTVFDEPGILDALRDVMTPARNAVLEETGSVDLALEHERPGGRRPRRFRVNVFRQLTGLAVAFRPVWDTVPSLSQLNLPDAVAPLVDLPFGLVLATGPTGAGKSTTLSALIELINTARSKHIITLEDPIEYVYERKKSFIHQREVGVHVESFAVGLKAALRESPDIILVGEMRDLDTISAALTAAETGHLVLSTLHTGSVAQAVDRMIDVFPEHKQSQVRIQLSDVLRAVIAQRLLPTVDGQHRVPAIELVHVNYAFANLIRDRKTHIFTSQIQATRKDGNIPFDTSLAMLVQQGLVSRETALRAAHDPQYLMTQIG